MYKISILKVDFIFGRKGAGAICQSGAFLKFYPLLSSIKENKIKSVIQGVLKKQPLLPLIMELKVVFLKALYLFKNV